MNDKELAGKIVALGLQREDFYLNMLRPTNEEFVRDWRVAGALMEKVWVDICHNTPEFLDFVNSRINGKSIHELPRAIIEACVEALESQTL